MTGRTLADLPKGLLLAGALLAASAAGYVLGVQPLIAERDALLLRIAAVEDQSRGTRAATEAARRELEAGRKLRSRYDEVTATGFSAAQDRLEVLRRLETIRVGYALDEANFSFAAERGVALRDAKADRPLVATAITLSTAALLDRDILAFWTDVLRQLPGKAVVSKLMVQLPNRVDSTLLSRLREPHRDPVVVGSIEMQWLTLGTPKKDQSK